MGDCADAKLVSRVTVPPIPKLGDMHMYWVWRMLIKSYLDAIGLWSGNHPKEVIYILLINMVVKSAQFVILRAPIQNLCC